MAMGDDRVGLLFWEMTLDDKEFKSKIKDSKKNLEGLDKNSKTSLGKMAGRFTLVATAVAAVGVGLAKFTADTVQAIAEQKILADSIGATTAEIAGLEIASQKLGIESSMVIDKMREFGGVNEFKKLADDVKNAGDASEQLAKSIELFGNEGTKILALLQLGSEGMKEFENQAIRTGNALSPEDTQKATEAWSDFQDLQIELKGATRELGVVLSEFLPVLTGTVSLIRDVGKATGETITGFSLWLDELLGVEDKTAQGFTFAEKAQMKAVRTQQLLIKEQRASAKEAKSLADSMKEVTFNSELFSQLNLEKDLLRVRSALGLTEAGFKKVSSTVTSALKRNESALQIIKDLSTGEIFSDEDFEFSLKNANVELGAGLFDFVKSIKKEAVDKSKDLAKQKKAQSKFIKDLQAGLDPQKFASKAMAGSVEAFRIIQGGKDTPAKETAKNTAKMAKQLEKLGII